MSQQTTCLQSPGTSDTRQGADGQTDEEYVRCPKCQGTGRIKAGKDQSWLMQLFVGKKKDPSQPTNASDSAVVASGVDLQPPDMSAQSHRVYIPRRPHTRSQDANSAEDRMDDNVDGEPAPANGEARADAMKQNPRYKDEIDQLQIRCTDVEGRLSKMASERMREGNPTVEDLNDPRRPTALVSRWTSLFRCGEYWTAYSNLASETGEAAAAPTLHTVCKVTYETTKTFVDDLTEALLAEITSREKLAARSLTPAPESIHSAPTSTKAPDDSAPTSTTANDSPLTSTAAYDSATTSTTANDSPLTSTAADDSAPTSAVAESGLHAMKVIMEEFLSDENQREKFLSELESSCLPDKRTSPTVGRARKVTQLLKSKPPPSSLKEKVYGALRDVHLTPGSYTSFVDQLLELVYYMRLQDIPMVVDFRCRAEATFNPDLYNAENSERKVDPRSAMVKAVLSPAVLRHESGPVMYRGEVEVVPRSCNKDAQSQQLAQYQEVL